MHVTKSATVAACGRKNLEAIRPSRRRFFPDVRTELLERTQNEVTLMKSMLIPASPRAWHESGQLISIDGQYNTGVCFPPSRSTIVEHPSQDQDPIVDFKMTILGPFLKYFSFFAAVKIGKKRVQRKMKSTL